MRDDGRLGGRDFTGVREDTLAEQPRRRVLPLRIGAAEYDARWRPTESLVRALLVGAATTVVALAWGRPDLWVLAAPLLLAGLAATRRPPTAAAAAPAAAPAHRVLPEGRATTVRTRLDGLPGAEQLTRAFDVVPFVDTQPGETAFAVACRPEQPTHELLSSVGVRRWGVREVGAGSVAATSAWAGHRWGPVRVPGGPLTALPGTAVFATRGQAPNPVGLVGAHRSARVGDGSEFSGIRPFAVGDRLRRINWRVSLATGDLHVVQTRADQDTAVLLLVDGSTDVGRSGGVDGAASSLDLTVRAAAALAEHHLGIGDRVGMRVLGSAVAPLAFGSGSAQRMRILHTLARLGRGRVDDDAFAGRLRLRAPEGTIVLMLTPMLTPRAAAVVATLARGSLPLVVVDTMPEDVEPHGDTAPDRAVATTAWAIRMVERQQVLDEVGRSGVAVVAWRGPGTLDDVLHRLARRAQLPRLVGR